MSEKPHHPLRVCLVAPAPPPYGGMTHWAQLLRTHVEGRSDIRLALVDVAPHWRQVHDNSKVKRIVFSGAAMFGHLGRVLRELIRGCDVVHVASPGQLATFRDIAILLLCRLWRVPGFYHLHFGRITMIASQESQEWRRLAVAIRLARATWVLDERSLRTIRRYLPKVRVQLMPNGLNVASLPRPSGGGDVRTVIYLGWVVPAKGINELILAWSELRPVGWRLLLVGPGDQAYQQKLLQQHRPERVEFAGPKSHGEAMQLLAAADVLVLPSHTEGLPYVVIEAMALGKPVIATTVGAIPEMLAGGCGITVPPQQVDRLKGALQEVLRDPERRAEMGAKGRGKASELYSMDAVFDRMMASWCGKLSGHSHALPVLRILMVGPASLEVVGGTTISFYRLLDAMEQYQDVQVEVLNSMGIRGTVLAPFRLARLLAQITLAARRSDVVAVHAMPTGLAFWGWYIALIRLGLSKPVVFRCFGGMYYDEVRKGLRWLSGILVRNADVTLLQTKELIARSKRDSVRKVEWFPTARPMPAEVPHRSGPCRRFVYVGHLKIRKGLQYLVAAAERLPEDAHVDVYGPWYDLPRDTFTGKQRITYHRELRPEDVAGVLQDHHALVLPSFLAEEGYAGIIPEAYAAGIPVITTRWKALPEIVEDGVSGLLVRPQSETELHGAMMRLYSDVGLYQRLAAGTAEMRERFSVQTQAENFVRICRQVAASA